MITILAIESSCDDTSAAVIRDGLLLSNVIAGQKVHEEFGGVVPELASRAHQQNILPVVDTALKRAGVEKSDLSAIAFTRGPGLLGSLLVGTSFAKGLALSLGIPLIEVNHLQGHVLAHFVRTPESTNPVPEFPFVHIEDGAHEGEVDLLLGLEGSVVFHTVVEIREVEGDPGTVIEGDGGLDVSEKASGFGLHPLTDGQ